MVQLERELAANYAEDRSDTRMIRAKLIVSEAAEVLEALRDRDEVALADGLADLEYVTIGTATAYLIPIGDVFDEVHRSNMTKSTVGEAVKNHSGDKGKGEDYSPPDVAGAIARGRSRRWVYKRGDQLATRDGRLIGNVTVTLVESDQDGAPITYEVLSDYGNTARFSPQEMASMFYAEPIGERPLRGQ
jgi:phosphoribosyl-ATP pyrophosphohydrolase